MFECDGLGSFAAEAIVLNVVARIEQERAKNSSSDVRKEGRGAQGEINDRSAYEDDGPHSG